MKIMIFFGQSNVYKMEKEQISLNVIWVRTINYFPVCFCWQYDRIYIQTYFTFYITFYILCNSEVYVVCCLPIKTLETFWTSKVFKKWKMR